MSAGGLLAVAVSGRGLVDPGEPVLVPDDEGFTRGRAAFETMRVYGGRPFRLAQHLARLQGSAERIGLERPDAGEIEALAALALERAAEPEAVLRLYWSPGPPGGEHRAIVLVGPIPGWIEDARARGQRLVSLLHPRRSASWLLPATKSTSYAVAIAAESEAKARGADDAVFVDADDIVLEGPVTNIWWREGDVLLTPSLDVGILAGETRAALLELARRGAWVVEEGAFPLERLLRADEVFTSSSVREVMPVVALDGRPVRARPGSGRAPGGAARGSAPLAGGGHARVTSRSHHEIGAADRVVVLDVAVLGRHPNVDPGPPRGLAVTRDRASEPDVVGRLDPDAHGVSVPELPVKRADPLHDHDAGGLDRPRATGHSGAPVVGRERCGLAAGERRDDLALEPVEVEGFAVPELVRRDDLGSGNITGERRLPRCTVSTDAD